MDLGRMRQEIGEVRGLIAQRCRRHIADLMGKVQTVDGWPARLAGWLGE